MQISPNNNSAFLKKNQPVGYMNSSVFQKWFVEGSFGFYRVTMAAYNLMRKRRLIPIAAAA